MNNVQNLCSVAMDGANSRRRGRPRKEQGEEKVKYRSVSRVDRERIVDTFRRGGNLKQLAATLGINIKTVRSIAATDRDHTRKRGGSARRFGPDIASTVCDIVDENPAFTLNQIRATLSEMYQGLQVSTSTIDRLLDGHGYTLKLAAPRPADRNRSDVKRDRRDYAQWLQNQTSNLSRIYVDETNFNVWCARSFARAKRGTPAVRMVPSTKGANINIIACMSADGLILWKAVDKVHWLVFNEFLAEASKQVQQNDPTSHAVFIFDNAPAHHRAGNATLASMTHSVKNLPPYSPFFNPIEEMFSKFKWHVKAFLSERHQELLTTPSGMTKKDHRRAMLIEAAVHSMQRVQSADCASYDEHTFSFLDAALNCCDM
ncbi:hypothetical protein HPB49_012979 [Dermacentor silvarum]|uniref:Uncharacterized protein n=1 Tax=Dermacentor silvarum TaxID=543639 RepID=A0ACB8E0M6_DERSI|nr:hypothetical protein HPB49_012979 [Dermacentor silvarum]